jgi:hypothetical protein
MRRFSILGVLGVLVLGAGLAMAAGPSSSPAPSGSPAPTTTGSSSTSTGTNAATAAQTSWSTDLRPLTGLSGSVHFRQNANGTGTVTLRLIGMVRAAPWVVEIDGGSATNPAIGDRVALRSGAGVARTGIDTLTIDLTKAEMQAFLHDLARDGVVVSVSDGVHESVASLPAS